VHRVEVERAAQHNKNNNARQKEHQTPKTNMSPKSSTKPTGEKRSSPSTPPVHVKNALQTKPTQKLEIAKKLPQPPRLSKIRYQKHTHDKQKIHLNRQKERQRDEMSIGGERQHTHQDRQISQKAGESKKACQTVAGEVNRAHVLIIPAATKSNPCRKRIQHPAPTFLSQTPASAESRQRERCHRQEQSVK
jgi:hypothetical protein